MKAGMSLFEPYNFAGLELKNRFMRSATTTYNADEEGNLREGAIQIYENLAKGDVGLIVKGHLGVTEEGRAHQGMAKISSDKNISKLKDLTQRVHKLDGVIIAQLNHAGIRNQPERIGPSQFVGKNWTSRGMEVEEIEGIIDAFGIAAERAIQAGFDGIQIHAAHGYLISQFLSSEVNKREDEWGGALENRMRFLQEVYKAIKNRIGKEPVMMKMNSDDFSSNGLDINQSIKVCESMSNMGIDLIEASGGGVLRNPDLYDRGKHNDPRYSNLTFAGHAEKIKKSVGDTPLALVEGYEALSTMKAVVEEGISDMVSMSRPFIREPNLVQNLKQGQEYVSCIRCDACSGSDVFGKTLLRCQID